MDLPTRAGDEADRKRGKAAVATVIVVSMEYDSAIQDYVIATDNRETEAVGREVIAQVAFAARIFRDGQQAVETFLEVGG